MRAFDYEDISLLASAYGAVDFKHQESKHSFTRFVLECHFHDGEIAVKFSNEMKIQIGYFTAIRVISEERCYVSVPCLDIDF